MTCPICASKTDERFRPFCSRHCADIDLGRWLDGVYAVPAEPADETALAKAGLPDAPERPNH